MIEENKQIATRRLTRLRAIPLKRFSLLFKAMNGDTTAQQEVSPGETALYIHQQTPAAFLWRNIAKQRLLDAVGVCVKRITDERGNHE